MFKGRTTCNTGGKIDSIFTLGEVVGSDQLSWNKSDHSWLKVKIALYDNTPEGEVPAGCPKHYVDINKAKEISRSYLGSCEIINGGWPLVDVADAIWN